MKLVPRDNRPAKQSLSCVRVPITIWYNTLCPVCNTGISWQKRLMMPAVRAGKIVFEDINQQPAALSHHGVDVEAIRKRLHATTADGELLVGADVVIAVLRLNPWQSWLGRLLTIPALRKLSHWFYDSFAEWLYAWNRRKGRW